MKYFSNCCYLSKYLIKRKQLYMNKTGSRTEEMPISWQFSVAVGGKQFPNFSQVLYDS